jgi:hypothetical protein
MGFRGFAIVVTVDHYGSPNVGNLGPRVLADGDAMVAILSDTDLCGYAAARITRLSGANATCAGVLGTMHALASTVTPDDPVLFYFSGHGDPPTATRQGSSLLPYDFDQVTGANVLTADALASAWGAVPSLRKLAIVDACYSGGLALAKAATGGRSRLDSQLLDRLASGRGSVALSSSRLSETSLILGGDPTSLFTKHLVAGLRGAAGHDGEGFIRVFDLFTYVAVSVRQEMPQQHPVYAAAHQEENFPVSYCSVPVRRKSRTLIGRPDVTDPRRMLDVFSALYPLGPIDQAVWERSGGELSRLVVTQQGRVDWFRALQTLAKGGGGMAISTASLLREALEDYPHHPDLKILVDRFGAGGF